MVVSKNSRSDKRSDRHAATENVQRRYTLATELGMTENAVNVAIHRLRKRYREVLQEQITETLDDTSQMDDEIRSLFAALDP